MEYFEEATVPLFDDNISVIIESRVVVVKGVYGKLSLRLHDVLHCKIVDKILILTFRSKKRYMNGKSLLGTACSVLRSMLLGVSIGFTKKLQLVGVGYRAVVVKDVISLTIGFSHVINYQLPDGVNVICPTPVDIVVNGADKQLVGQVAADLRAIHPPQSFSGKGIRYVDEVLRIKEIKKK